MSFNLTTPCHDCLFRCDREPRVRPQRAEDISVAVLRGDSFPCIQSVDEAGFLCDAMEGEHCAGVTIILEKLNKPNQMMRVSERLGLYDYRKLDMKAPVYDSFGEFVVAAEGYDDWSAEEKLETVEYIDAYLVRKGRRTIIRRKVKADPPVAQGGRV